MTPQPVSQRFFLRYVSFSFLKYPLQVKMGERQGIKGSETTARNGTSAAKTRVRVPGLSTDRVNPFCGYFGAG